MPLLAALGVFILAHRHCEFIGLHPAMQQCMQRLSSLIVGKPSVTSYHLSCVLQLYDKLFVLHNVNIISLKIYMVKDFGNWKYHFKSAEGNAH